MISLVKLALFFASLLTLSGCTKSASPNQVHLIYKNKTIKLSDQKRDGLLWKTVSHLDPNTNKTLTYSGYKLSELIPKISPELDLESFFSLKIKSRDGYVTQLPYTEIKKTDAFLALEVSGYGDKGIYNLSLKSYFDWRPGYLIYLKKSDSYNNSSPYQITDIEFETSDSKKSLLGLVPKVQKKSAQVFIKTCNKCHSHKGFGGKKAPIISVLTGKWKSDEHLKTFLREPQKTLGRPIEMSGYKGSERDLEDLVRFLRSIEI